MFFDHSGILHLPATMLRMKRHQKHKPTHAATVRLKKQVQTLLKIPTFVFISNSFFIRTLLCTLQSLITIIQVIHILPYRQKLMQIKYVSIGGAVHVILQIQ